MNTLSRPAAIYVAALSLMALGLSVKLVAPIAAPATVTAMQAAICAVLMTAAWLRPIPFGAQRKLYLDDSVLVATILLLRPGVAMVVAGAGTLLAHVIRREDRVQAVFNASQITLKAGSGAVVLVAFGAGFSGEVAGDFQSLGLILVASLVMFVANLLMVSTMVALFTGESLLLVWSQSAREVNHFDVLAYLMQVSIGGCIAAVTSVASWALVSLLLPTFILFKLMERNNARQWRIGAAFRAFAAMRGRRAYAARASKGG
jgi:hypothetical protein